MKTNIQILLLAAILFFAGTVITLLDIDLVSCYLKWWQILGFDLVIIIIIAIIYVQLNTKKDRRQYRDWEDYQ